MDFPYRMTSLDENINFSELFDYVRHNYEIEDQFSSDIMAKIDTSIVHNDLNFLEYVICNFPIRWVSIRYTLFKAVDFNSEYIFNFLKKFCEEDDYHAAIYYCIRRKTTTLVHLILSRVSNINSIYFNGYKVGLLPRKSDRFRSYYFHGKTPLYSAVKSYEYSNKEVF